ncbi:hypothetical protein [Spirosoma panaciterrae]|uniref:hypothetical protein n=1 Tax=Spirosoma panaciterrae TaxID=496058 RepID=UPI00039CD27E|nr:hypothetical protein [Spirosoma panaciterrae]
MNKTEISIDNEDIKKFYTLLAEQEKREKEEIKKKEAATTFQNEELPKLVWWSRFVFISLIAIIITGCILLSLYESFRPFWVCIISGVLGSAFAAFLSALDRSANGWESNNGDKYPKEEPKDKFSKRMATFFLCRPIFGLLAGLLVYFGMQSKTVGKVDLNTNNSDIIFFSLVAGFFIKLLMDKLKDLIDSLFKIK